MDCRLMNGVTICIDHKLAMHTAQWDEKWKILQ